MSGAAPRHSRRTHVVLQLAAALIVLASVLADGSAAAAPKLPGSVWGVAVTSSPARDVAWKVSATLPKKGFNTVVVDRRVLSAPGYVAFRRQARKLHLTLVAGRQSGTACTSCLPLVGSATAGVKLSRTGATVLVRIGSPARIHQLRGLRKGRTIAIVELRGGAAFSASAWRRAIAVARKEPRLDLVVAPTGARAASALAAYTRLLGERTAVSTPEPPAPGTPPGGGGASDTLAPTIPGSFSKTASTTTSISVMWSASIDNVAVSFYGLFRNGASAATATGTSYAFTGLACGTTYSLGVEAADAAGNSSSRATISAATSSCSSPTPPPVPNPPPGPTPPPAPPTGTANLWIDLNGGSCTRQATAGAYVDAQACGSWNAAYQAASPGDTVLDPGWHLSLAARARPHEHRRRLDLDHLPSGSGREHPDGSLQLYAHDFILDGGDVPGANETNRITIRGEQAPDEEALGMRDNQGTQNGQTPQSGRRGRAHPERQDEQRLLDPPLQRDRPQRHGHGESLQGSRSERRRAHLGLGDRIQPRPRQQERRLQRRHIDAFDVYVIGRRHPRQPDLVVRDAVHLHRRPVLDPDREQHDRGDQRLRRRL